MAKKKTTRVKVLPQSEKIPEHLKTAPPEQIAAYKKWIREGKRLRAHPKRYCSVPDPEDPSESIEVDLIHAVPVIRKRISHLPNDVQDNIMLGWRELQVIKSGMGALKRKWNPPHYGDPESLTGLTPEQNAEIIHLFGTWKTNGEVRKVIYDKWGYDVKPNNISAFKIANKEKIDGLRSEWEKSYDGFDISHKRGRIEKLAFLAKTQMDKYKHRNGYSVVHSRELRAILEQIRKEVEGERLHIDIEGNIDVNATINMNLSIQRLTQKISINSFVVALVAAKRGIDGVSLMHKLTKSFYNQYNGFMRVSDNTGEPEYPSNLIQTYDWNEIERNHTNGKVINYETVSEAEVVEESKEDDLKSKMMDMLMKKQGNLAKIQGKK